MGFIPSWWWLSVRSGRPLHVRWGKELARSRRTGPERSDLGEMHLCGYDKRLNWGACQGFDASFRVEYSFLFLRNDLRRFYHLGSGRKARGSCPEARVQVAAEGRKVGSPTGKVFVVVAGSFNFDGSKSPIMNGCPSRPSPL